MSLKKEYVLPFKNKPLSVIEKAIGDIVSKTTESEYFCKISNIEIDDDNKIKMVVNLDGTYWALFHRIEMEENKQA